MYGNTSSRHRQTEIHVFWNPWAGIPLDIATPPNGTIWSLSKGKISLVQRGKAK
jgi:hypothetical protein